MALFIVLCIYINCKVIINVLLLIYAYFNMRILHYIKYIVFYIEYTLICLISNILHTPVLLLLNKTLTKTI